MSGTSVQKPLVYWASGRTCCRVLPCANCTQTSPAVFEAAHCRRQKGTSNAGTGSLATVEAEGVATALRDQTAPWVRDMAAVVRLWETLVTTKTPRARRRAAWQNPADERTTQPLR